MREKVIGGKKARGQESEMEGREQMETMEREHKQGQIG